MLFKQLSFLVFISAVGFSVSEELFELSVIHLNDFHARFEQTTAKSAPCRRGDESECIGGISRVVTVIKQLMKERPNPLLLNAGDNYQGTLFFNFFGYKLISEVMNTLPFHAHTIGNHEFDNKVDGLVPFLKELKAPVIVANMDDSKHPEIQGLYKKSIVVEIAGKRIGIIGVIYPKTNEISNSENIVFLDESETVNAEADRLAKEENVFTVIVLSHCGYDLDMEIARRARPNIGLVVGAHSHTLLYRGEAPDVATQGSTVLGTYPSIIKRTDGGNVYVVQASCYTKYLGSITIKYDYNGQVRGWVEDNRSKGLPIYMAHDIEQDRDMLKFLTPYINKIQSFGGQIIGETKNLLFQGDCKSTECTLGNMVADAMLTTNLTVDALASFINAGGLRTSIEAGKITYNDLASAVPFENTFDVGTMSGAGIRACAEHMAKPTVQGKVNMLQVSGLQMTLDLTKPADQRVTKLKIRISPDVYEDVEDSKDYRLSVINFLLSGGDGFTCFPENFKDHKEGNKDIVVLEKFIRENIPLDYEKENRIEIIGA